MTKRITLFLFLLILFIIFLLAGCSASPYWRVYRHDGIEKRGYLKAGWPHDSKCATYYSGNRPVQHKTWKSQYYWRKSKQ